MVNINRWTPEIKRDWTYLQGTPIISIISVYSKFFSSDGAYSLLISVRTIPLTCIYQLYEYGAQWFILRLKEK